jgi:carbamoyl-phosphate synthase large subunit
MKESKGKTVLVTGIGGNVGYGILMNIRRSFPHLKIIGINTKRVSSGNHLCDEVVEVPFALDTGYLPAVRKLYKDFNIDLIIPSTDYESFVLSAERDAMNIAVSPAGVTQIFLDKYISYKKLKEFDLAFAESILPSEYKNEFGEYIVKPREGRGSRGVFYNPGNPGQFSDENIIQPLLKGAEITTAVYITRKNKCHGFITMERQLDHGATYQCEVVKEYDHLLNEYIQKLITHMPFSGSFNIQSMVVEGKIIPFEVNCRISGTNSIRSHFGFRDVEYTIYEYLYNEEPEPVVITPGSAIRILYDIIYPEISLKDINNKSDHFFMHENGN